MLIIPVIDIKDGKCVRVVEGHQEYTHYYSDNPVQVAKLFRKENFKTIHITDLDGALYGEMKNLNVIKEIAHSVDIPVQLGGGVRNIDTARMMIEEIGVYRLVIGTAAINKNNFVEDLLKAFSPYKIVVCIDDKGGNVVKNGWNENTDITPVEFAKRMYATGVKRIIYQDVGRVGTLLGPNLETLKLISRETNLKITAAGGIRNFADLKNLAALNIPSIDSIMVSRALYENKFPCQQLWRDMECEDKSLELPASRF